MAAHDHAYSVTLADLLPGLELGSAAFVSVKNVSLDSRTVKAGDLFIAVAGSRFDGQKFIGAAIAQGAVAVLTEAGGQGPVVSQQDGVAVIAVNNLAREVSAIAGRFYSEPSRRLRLVGITGTNGKTTCSLLLGQLAALLHERAAVIGTLGFGLLDSTLLAPLAQQIGALQATGLTTPDPVAMQRIIAGMSEQSAVLVAAEVSSHSLLQKRVAALQFDTAIFTNLTQDHLDYHGDLVSYGKAKELLLQMPKLRVAIVNQDDAWSKSLTEKAPEAVAVTRYSLHDASADVYAKDVQLSEQGASAWLVTPWGEGQLNSPLLGEFNLSNLLAVISAMCVAGSTLDNVLKHVSQLQPAPGRMQSVALDQSNQDITAIVDYAHTPDALEVTLNAIRRHTSGRLWTVFGCGGDRDKKKRPLMGRIAERLSDYVIITNDNPRNEDPAGIAADILRGMHNSHGCLVIADRAQAIDLAVQQAKSGDVVLIAGKGHEDYQIFAAQTLPFSDVKQLRLALQRRIARRDADTEPEVPS